MRAITAVGATPSRMGMIFRVLRDSTDRAKPLSELRELFTPAKLSKSDDPKQDNALSDTVSAGIQMGLFLQVESILSLAIPDTQRSFLDEVRALTLQGAGLIDEQANWLAGAIAWLLCQDEPVSWSNGNELLNRHAPELSHRFGMTNNSSFQQAVYWARALGFVDRFDVGGAQPVLADPTNALVHVLPDILQKDAEKPLVEFLNDLAAHCPVFDRGSLRVEVEAACGIARESSTVSKSLALAFNRLSIRKVLDFTYLDDAPDTIFVDGLRNDRASHVRRLN